MGQNAVSCVELESNKELTGHTKAISTLQYFNGKLYSGSHDATLRQWDPSGTCLYVFKGHSKFISAMITSTDGIIYTGSDDGEIRCFAAERQVLLHIMKGHTKTISSLTLHKKYLYSGSFDSDIRKWDCETGECVQVFKGHTDIVTGIVVKGDYIYSASADKTIKKWNTEDGTLLLTFNGHTSWVMDLCIMEDGFHMYTCSQDKTIRKWNCTTGKLMNVIEDAKDCVSRIVVSKNADDSGATHLLSASWDGIIREYSVDDGDQLVRELKGHSTKIKNIMVKGRILISGGDDNDVRIWDLKHGKTVCILKVRKPFTSICRGKTNNVLYVATKAGSIKEFALDSSKNKKFDGLTEDLDQDQTQTHYSEAAVSV
ncbi:hypothetical protein ABK040_001464 [Willaertia magna]